MLTFVKLGGSLITDKRVEGRFRESEVSRIAKEIRSAMTQNSDIRLLVGHGSGSFGHFVASRHRTIEGVHSPEEWRGFAHVAVVASELNRLVSKAFLAADVAVWPIQPSASALSRGGVVVRMAVDPIRQAIVHGLVPLVYGDVGIDEALGGTILSTEAIFSYLVRQLDVSRVLLLGEVEGVLDGDGRVIRSITPQTYGGIAQALGGSGGVDVTGGMLAKVRAMLELVAAAPRVEVRIIDGRQPGLLEAALLGQANPGTLVVAHP